MYLVCVCFVFLFDLFTPCLGSPWGTGWDQRGYYHHPSYYPPHSYHYTTPPQSQNWPLNAENNYDWIKDRLKTNQSTTTIQNTNLYTSKPENVIGGQVPARERSDAERNTTHTVYIEQRTDPEIGGKPVPAMGPQYYRADRFPPLPLTDRFGTTAPRGLPDRLIPVIGGQVPAREQSASERNTTHIAPQIQRSNDPQIGGVPVPALAMGESFLVSGKGENINKTSQNTPADESFYSSAEIGGIPVPEIMTLVSGEGEDVNKTSQNTADGTHYGSAEIGAIPVPEIMLLVPGVRKNVNKTSQNTPAYGPQAGRAEIGGFPVLPLTHQYWTTASHPPDLFAAAARNHEPGYQIGGNPVPALSSESIPETAKPMSTDVNTRWPPPFDYNGYAEIRGRPVPELDFTTESKPIYFSPVVNTLRNSGNAKPLGLPSVNQPGRAYAVPAIGGRQVPTLPLIPLPNQNKTGNVAVINSIYKWPPHLLRPNSRIGNAKADTLFSQSEKQSASFKEASDPLNVTPTPSPDKTRQTECTNFYGPGKNGSPPVLLGKNCYDYYPTTPGIGGHPVPALTNKPVTTTEKVTTTEYIPIAAEYPEIGGIPVPTIEAPETSNGIHQLVSTRLPGATTEATASKPIENVDFDDYADTGDKKPIPIESSDWSSRWPQPTSSPNVGSAMVPTHPDVRPTARPEIGGVAAPTLPLVYPEGLGRPRPDDTSNYCHNCYPQIGSPVTSVVTGNIPSLQWHVGIYSKLFTPYKQICGGSIISTTAVVTAAHCFWSDESGLQQAARYAVAAGKLTRPWNYPLDIAAQMSDIKEILVPPRFRGINTNFQDDIAVLLLTNPFTFTPGVQPVCLTLDEESEGMVLKKGNKGTVLGWGLTEEYGKPASHVNYLELPYVEIGECIDNAPPGFQKYITSDKICAGDAESGKALCRGDSGGGLIFNMNGISYLAGVASTAPRSAALCNSRAVPTFTSVRAHKELFSRANPSCSHARNATRESETDIAQLNRLQNASEEKRQTVLITIKIEVGAGNGYGVNVT